MLALEHISPLETLMDPDSHVSKTGFKKTDDAADELHCSGCGCTHVKGIARGPRPFTVSAASQAAGKAPRPVMVQQPTSHHAMPRAPQVSMQMPPRLPLQPPSQAQQAPAAPLTSPVTSQKPVSCQTSQASTSGSSSHRHEGLPPQAAPVASAAGRVTDWPKQVFCSTAEYDWTFTKEVIRPDSAMILAISSLDKDLDGKGTADLVRELGG
ncbi:hypothetical protein AK812_SmicGene12455 [Symbiodinium microadriaticum]|uniref:Uncharacterized protein n=1 Tax=Symbiodinium microadriaticum TaxID=2951 RepID=A0A1Q9EAR0_SYMMI|nr:hypothetical protein AK812_SmicGene12455 [Symbiodinium microadriaticum]CAE7895102.1 unnamed protein product [Symbiodinium microadriaticum]